LNNTLKHAKATEIDIHIYFEKEKFKIDYQDDGIGFDMNSVASKDGRGLTNIYNRIDYISGKVDLESKPGVGTHVKIEVERKYLA
jgi:two-component system NarL family sensor kinase